VTPLRWPPHATEDVRLDDVTILVVDDQRDSREMLAMLLEHRGGHVRQCDCAESALHLISSESIDIVIADIAMPNVDGYELIRRFRLLKSEVPAVAVTALARPGDRQRAIAAGFTEYCAKPIDGVQLARIVRALTSASSSA
jgi:CheY-like chemotaxis protein